MHREKKRTEKYHIGKTMTTPSPRESLYSPGWYPAGSYIGSARPGTYPKCAILYTSRNIHHSLIARHDIFCRNSEAPTVLKRAPTLYASAQPSPTMIRNLSS